MGGRGRELSETLHWPRVGRNQFYPLGRGISWSRERELGEELEEMEEGICFLLTVDADWAGHPGLGVLDSLLPCCRQRVPSPPPPSLG